ncbi:hypothetical protein [Pontivivens nitratireducens]|uniref:Uncharacterized protein n=1 Tax=Pontivivens nitratireducens TaxID=2758038 RepID=A0A6G7VI11_9RHOB|nr:hypothetical protein [Pontibrevibacter nitratireducens]QIK39516.1 hypothetical protein G8E03_01315 [Pontibrevibacter nitratireducens]
MQHLFITVLVLASFAGAGSAMACTAGEAIVPTLIFDDLTPVEREAFDTLFTAERAVMQTENTDVDAAFAFQRCDLAADGNATVMVFAKPGLFCEVDCLSWAINRTQDEHWQIILAALGHVEVAGSYSMSWPDLIARVQDQPAIVHKYDGASYREELEGLIYGEAFDLPEAVAWEADESGFVGIVPGSSGPNGEAVLALDMLANTIDPGLGELVAGLTDLNGDDVPEIVVQGEGADYCSADGCRTWIIGIRNGEAHVLADVTAQGSLEIASTTSDGYRDVIVWGDAGAQVLRHDGEVYR